MIIHVVQEGESLETIGEQYGVSPERLIIDNELPNPNNLVVGQSMIVRVPTLVHTVVGGETLSDIATSYNITVTEILRNNPWVAGQEGLEIGQTLLIAYEKDPIVDTALINGYLYPFIDRIVFQKSLPFLTYQLIFTYGFTTEGDLVPLDDEDLIANGYEQGVPPIMVLAPMAEDMSFDSQLAQAMFVNVEAQNRLIENIVSTMQEKGFIGLDIDFEFIQAEYKEQFISFISNVKNNLQPLGFLTMVALAPKTSGEMTGVLYEAHDYPAIGAIADIVLIMTYEWGYLYGPPMATAPLNNVRQVLEYAVSTIPNEKILMGIPNYSYDWPLPFVRGETVAEALSNQEAIARAAEYGVTIEFDQLAQAPFYYYTDEAGVEHVVWFDDARSMNAKFRLIPELQLRGASIWQIMNFFPAMYMIINNLFTIEEG
ncbi:MAG: LysM peptidoglycan-binding domain-containing protein [Clostridiales bacterium]|jgi:spore germination protein|nr:LysM peptidoglycan-binding domain-containing protein [Clostridiales bacterium]